MFQLNSFKISTNSTKQILIIHIKKIKIEIICSEVRMSGAMLKVMMMTMPSTTFMNIHIMKLSTGVIFDMNMSSVHKYPHIHP
jgi:hypothetical protein